MLRFCYDALKAYLESSASNPTPGALPNNDKKKSFFKFLLSNGVELRDDLNEDEDPPTVSLPPWHPQIMRVLLSLINTIEILRELNPTQESTIIPIREKKKTSVKSCQRNKVSQVNEPPSSEEGGFPSVACSSKDKIFLFNTSEDDKCQMQHFHICGITLLYPAWADGRRHAPNGPRQITTLHQFLQKCYPMSIIGMNDAETRSHSRASLVDRGNNSHPLISFVLSVTVDAGRWINGLHHSDATISSFLDILEKEALEEWHFIVSHTSQPSSLDPCVSEEFASLRMEDTNEFDCLPLCGVVRAIISTCFSEPVHLIIPIDSVSISFQNDDSENTASCCDAMERSKMIMEKAQQLYWNSISLGHDEHTGYYLMNCREKAGSSAKSIIIPTKVSLLSMNPSEAIPEDHRAGIFEHIATWSFEYKCSSGTSIKNTYSIIIEHHTIDDSKKKRIIRSFSEQIRVFLEKIV